MTFYALLVFVHVTAATLMFAAWSIEAVAAGQLDVPTDIARARSWNDRRRRAFRAGWFAIGGVLASGVWMMALRWGPRPWMITGFVGLLIIAIAGAAVFLRTRSGLDVALRQGGNDSVPLLRPAAELVLFSVRLRAAVGIGVLGLMTLRPGVLGSILMLTAAVASVVVHRLAVGAGRRSAAAMIAES